MSKQDWRELGYSSVVTTPAERLLDLVATGEWTDEVLVALLAEIEGRARLVARLEAPIRVLYSKGPNWVPMAMRDQAVVDIRDVLAELDKA